MAAMSQGSELPVHVYEVFCLLCFAKLDSAQSRINVRGRSSFPVEAEIRKLPLNIIIDDNTRICFPCLRKLKKRKALEENFAAATEELVRSYGNTSKTKEFVPSFVSTPTKAGYPSTTTTCTATSSTPRTCLPQTTQRKEIEPGVTVS